MRSQLAVLFCLCMAASVQAEEVYKWVDAEGVVHFSATPPLGQTVQQEDLRYHRGDPAAAAAARKRWDDEQKQQREKAEAAAKAGAEQGAQQGERQRACADAREIIQRLQTAPAARYRREDGSFMNYSPEEVASRMAEAKAREQEYCD